MCICDMGKRMHGMWWPFAVIITITIAITITITIVIVIVITTTIIIVIQNQIDTTSWRLPRCSLHISTGRGKLTIRYVPGRDGAELERLVSHLEAIMVWGFPSSSWCYPNNWLVYFMENPHLEMDD